MTAYYNEHDAYAAAWLRNLIAAGQIAPGDVDARDIQEVTPDDLAGYAQCHFFAGLGGWSHALRLAGWPDARPVWTGSCPCQPLSSAGQRHGHADRRHLWPAFQSLIAECRPATVFGEQVASRDGREWLAGVRADLEHLGYACGCADLPAASLGAPHIRQRLWFVAERLDDATGSRRTGAVQPGTVAAPRNETRLPEPQRRGRPGRLADADVAQSGHGGLQRSGGFVQPAEDKAASNGLADAETAGSPHRGARPVQPEPGEGRRAAGGLGDADGTGHAVRKTHHGCEEEARDGSPKHSPWFSSAWIPCTDGHARRVEPGVEPLAHGVPARVGQLRAYGNAIVPQVAAVFIRAYREGCEMTILGET